MSGFVSLKPAMTGVAEVENTIPVGDVGSSGALSILRTKGGTMKTEPGFSPAFEAELLPGMEWIRLDVSGKQVRMDADGLMKDKKTGQIIAVHYQGFTQLTEGIGLIMSGSPDSKTTEFGASVAKGYFETGEATLKDLEAGIFVAGARFIVEAGQPLKVEYKISQLVA